MIFRNTTIAAAIIAATAVLSACGGGGGGAITEGAAPPPISQVVSVQGCQTHTSAAPVAGTHNGYTAHSGTWNTSAASVYSFCVNAAIDAVTDSTNTTFEWLATSSSTPGVIAYPSIYVGWAPGQTNNSNILPTPVTSNKRLIASGSITTKCVDATCIYGSIFDILLTDTATPTSWPPAHEIMVLTTYQYPWFLGVPTYTTVIDNIVYSAYVDTMGSASTGGTWGSITYVPATPITDFNINISNIVNDAAARGIVKKSEYIALVGLGTEVISGKGTTNISNYRLKLN